MNIRTAKSCASAQQRCGEFVHGGSHRILDRLHVVDLRGVVAEC
jgi:hypothetical protein